MSSLKAEFIKYLSDNYLNRINNDINSKLVEFNITGILLRTEISDLSALDNDELEFVFKIKVRSEFLTLTGNTSMQSFDIEYSCILNNGIHNLTLKDLLKSGTKRFTYTNSLTECFIPLNKKENYEKLSIRFLKHYLKGEYNSFPLDVNELIRKVGVTPVISSNFSDTLGKTVFSDCQLNLGQDNKLKLVKKGSIVINTKNLLMTANDKLARITIVHECLHWHYHKKAFEIIMLLNDKYKYFDCTEYEPNNDDPIITALGWMEAQAYALARTCMMLGNNVNYIIDDEYKNMEVAVSDGVDKADYLYSIVAKSSNEFGLPMKDVVKRLILLGYEEFENFKNDYYGPIYDTVLQHEKLGPNQTRRIEQRIFDFMMKNSPNLKVAIESGLYVYADGFVVINLPKYVIRIGDWYMLNTYARDHIEECSLIFNIKKEYKYSFSSLHLITANSGSVDSTILVGDACAYIIDPCMIPSILNQPIGKRNHLLTNSYIHDDEQTFSQYFKSLIKKYGFDSVQEIVDATHCSRSVIENYRDYDDIGYSVEKVLSICAGMKLTPPEAKHLVRKSGVVDLFSKSHRSKVYLDLINNHWEDGIEKWNVILNDKKVPPLYKD